MSFVIRRYFVWRSLVAVFVLIAFWMMFLFQVVVPALRVFGPGVSLLGFVMFILLMFLSTVWISFLIGTKRCTARIDNGALWFEGEKIIAEGIHGFRMDRNIFFRILEIKRDGGHVLTLASLVIGPGRKTFDRFVSVFQELVLSKAPHTEELTLAAMHPSQARLWRPFLWGLTGLVIVADIVFVYLMITRDLRAPASILIMNAVGISTYLRLRSKEW